MSNSRLPSERQPTTRLRWWWAVSIALIIIGLVGFFVMARGPAEGPTVPSQFGKTSLAPSQYKSLTGQDSGSSTTTTMRPSSTPVSPVTASLVSISAPSASTWARHAGPAVLRTPRISERRASLVRLVPRSRPVHLWIPNLKVSVSLGVVGLNPDNTVQVPTNFAQPGWYKYGPTPGQIGSAVILGHVDSHKGPAVFFYLNQLRKGNKVIIKLASGRTLTFSVTALRIYSKDHFPDRVVYGPRPYSALQLVTCGGVFDPQTGHYLSNIVAFTVLVKS